jgi:hypothetical protein
MSLIAMFMAVIGTLVHMVVIMAVVMIFVDMISAGSASAGSAHKNLLTQINWISA